MATTADSATPVAPLTESDIRTIIIGIMLAMFLAALDQTIVATAMPTIGKELGDVTHLPWVVTSYLLSSTAVTPLYGKIADIHGRRITLLAGISIFILGSVACALAPTMWALIIARFMQGVGGGGLISMAQTIIGDMLPPRERSRYQVYIASVFMTSSVLGPVLGGYVSDVLHWSAIFWINVPLGLGAYAMTSSALKRLPRHERPHKLDVAGALLITCATITLLLALTWGGVSYRWNSPQILGLLAGSALLWAGFTWRLKTAEEPLIPLAILANPVVRHATVAAGFGMGTFIGLTIFLPVYFESVVGLTPSHSGLGLIPLSGGTVVGAMLGGRGMTYLKNYKRVPLIGLSVSLIGLAGLIFFASHMNLAVFCTVLGFISAGFGTVLPVSTVSIQNAVSHHQLGTATATANFFRQIGGALIVALLGAIILGGFGGEAGGVEHMRAVAIGPAAMAQVFTYVFIACFIGFALSLLAISTMEQLPLRSSAIAAAKEVVAD